MRASVSFKLFMVSSINNCAIINHERYCNQRYGCLLAKHRYDTVDDVYDTVDDRYDTVDARYDTVDDRYDTVDALS